MVFQIAEIDVYIKDNQMKLASNQCLYHASFHHYECQSNVCNTSYNQQTHSIYIHSPTY